MRLCLVTLVLAVSSACGPTVPSESSGDPCDPGRRHCTVTLAPTELESALLELSRSRVLVGEADYTVETEVEPGFLWAGVFDTLAPYIRAPVDGEFCVHGRQFAQASDVPTEPCPSDCRGLVSPCRLTRANLEDYPIGSGFLATTRSDEHYQVRIVDFTTDPAEIILEYTAVR